MAARKGMVQLAVEHDLERLGGDVAASAVAATAIALARELDEAKNSATSKSMCARVLGEALDRLRELAPPEDEGDRLDDLSARRAARLARGAAASDSSRP